MTESVFKSELEKEVWASVYTRYEPKGADTQARMRAAWSLVVELRESLDKLLAFGAWTRAAAEILGEEPSTPGAGAFRTEIEKKIWVAGFTRYIGGDDAKSRSAEGRAKRAWEFVLEFRNPKREENDGWEQAARELAGNRKD